MRLQEYENFLTKRMMISVNRVLLSKVYQKVKSLSIINELDQSIFVEPTYEALDNICKNIVGENSVEFHSYYNQAYDYGKEIYKELITYESDSQPYRVILYYLVIDRMKKLGFSVEI